MAKYNEKIELGQQKTQITQMGNREKQWSYQNVREINKRNALIMHGQHHIGITDLHTK